MSDFLELTLTPTASGRGGSFTCDISFSLDNFPMLFKGIPAKIDIGCSISTIPARRLNIPKTICAKKKEEDIDKGLPYVYSYGIESIGRNHLKHHTKMGKMRCSALKFCHGVSDFKILGMAVPISDIFVNYDRTGHILIGTDILEHFITVFDLSRVTGKYTMLACLRELPDKSAFTAAVNDHFGL